MENAVWDLKSQLEKGKETPAFDCMIAESLLNLGHALPDTSEVLKQYKVNSLTDVSKIQFERLKQDPKLLDLFTEIEMPLTYVLFSMEYTGISLDHKRLKQIGDEISLAMEKLQTDILQKVGFEINLNSSAQVGTYLFDKEGVPLGKTKTGKYATNESELSQFAEQFPIIKQILNYRELAKLKSTYVDSLIQKIGEDGRIHTTYHQVGIATGRLASSNPNLQNIPDNSVFGNKIKSCFTASTGHTLISFDYSQQELRILAHLTGEEKLIDAFQKSEDVHKITASQLFHVPQNEISKEQRNIGKTINFGIIYGMGAYGLSEALKIPEHDAQIFIREFFANFPKIKKFYDEYIKQGMIHRHVETILGRKRFIFTDPKQKFLDNATRRMLLNYPIQGSAADLMKLAMVKVYKNIVQKDPEIKLLLQIHDDLVFEIPNSNKTKIKETINKIRDTLCTVYPLIVPMAVEVKIGDKWGEMIGYSEVNS